MIKLIPKPSHKPNLVKSESNEVDGDGRQLRTDRSVVSTRNYCGCELVYRTLHLALRFTARTFDVGQVVGHCGESIHLLLEREFKIGILILR